MAQRALQRLGELQHQLQSGSINRRDFLRYAGMLGMSLAAAEALAACTPAAAPTTAPPAAGQPVPTCPPPTAGEAPPAETVEVFGYPGFVWNPPYAGLEFDYDKCNGCRICEAACSVKNFGELRPDLSRIRIYDFNAGLVVVGSICWGCQWSGGSAAGGLDPFCMEACPTEPNAITWHPELSVPVVNEDVCIQCGLCYEACPCLLYTSPSPRDRQRSRMPSSA